MRSNSIKKFLYWAGIGLGGVIVILGSLLSIYHLTYLDKIYPYVKVSDLDLSNLTIQEAKDKLKQMVSTGKPVIELEFDNQDWQIEIKDLSYDPRSTAETAYVIGRSGSFSNNLKTKWRLWWEKKEVLMKYQVDNEALGEKIELILSQVEEPVIEPRLKLDENNQVSLIPGRNGRLVEKEKLWEMIDQKIGSLSFSKLKIPVKMVRVEVGGKELALAQERAEILKLKSLTISYEEYEQSIKGEELLSLIDFSGGWDKQKIASITASLAEGINREPQDAAFQFENGRVTEFRPALNGLTVDEKASVEKIASKFEDLEKCKEEINCEKISVQLVVSQVPPEVSIAEVNDLGIKELLGKGESYFHGSIPSREHNIALTAAKLNGALIKPGEVFSFNQTVGDISQATGYQSAYIIKNNRTVLGDGGGVCQDSTTMFRAVLDAGLEIVERQAHAYRVSYYEQNAPVGLDATVYAQSPDFKFRNDTPAHILIQTYVNRAGNYLKIDIYGTSDGRVATINNTRLWDQVPPPAPLYQEDPSLPSGTVKQIDWEAWGAKAAFDWKVVRNGEVLHEKIFYSSYKPWQAVYLRGTG